MIIAQVTDLHIGFDGPDKLCQNTLRLRAVLTELQNKIARPDLIIFTGDLVESGENWAYEKLKTELAPLEIPYYFAFGNHDSRDEFTKAFPEILLEGGFLQYTIEDGPVRIIVLDSLEHGRHGGGFCENRAQWLSERLAEQIERPTLIALHHPPIPTGIDWMTIADNEDWVERLETVLRGRRNIIQIICGHIHRSIFSQFADHPLTVSLATAPQVKLELAKIDPNTPDNRVLLTDAPAGYCLHHWDGKKMTTHSGTAPDGKAVIHYDEQHAFVIKHTMDLPSKA